MRTTSVIIVSMCIISEYLRILFITQRKIFQNKELFPKGTTDIFQIEKHCLILRIIISTIISIIISIISHEFSRYIFFAKCISVVMN